MADAWFFHFYRSAHIGDTVSYEVQVSKIKPYIKNDQDLSEVRHIGFFYIYSFY